MKVFGTSQGGETVAIDLSAEQVLTLGIDPFSIKLMTEAEAAKTWDELLALARSHDTGGMLELFGLNVEAQHMLLVPDAK